MTSRGIDRVLNNFLKDNEIDCRAEMGTDFAYYTDDEIVTYSLVVSERMNDLFLQFAQARGLKVDCGIFLLSFFHEVGHHLTIDDLTEEEEEECEAIKASLNSEDDKDCVKYFSLLDECLATSWAIDYINEHVKEVEQLALKLQKAIHSFMKANNVES